METQPFQVKFGAAKEKTFDALDRSDLAPKIADAAFIARRFVSSTQTHQS
jgi:hypothetical protein